MKKKIMYFCLTTAVLAGACKKDNVQEIDTEYPVINITADNAFPKQCSTVKRGEKFTFRARLDDNVALGSVNVDIHHNFDHHSHSTEVESCGFEPVKTPVKPFLLIQSYDIPENLKTYEVLREISIPADIDPGDYHFLIRLTDETGWQTIKGLSIKID